ncbi:hypothetical protein G7Z12_00900 [Streptomyces sp. ID38640]|uniref:hypothetical protein n=1 Tax=Streptomyces sp. ID38640 TaxID=1265399 RepID=UPI00140EA718|nr:hypothetical protein [Streptomyces sp. ID38640]QIK04828.1 hypothetical protein G7Z12_00900 [Streptomyces sp. ID38640]
MRLKARDYGIELVTDYGPDDREAAQELARHFVTWRDGDHGAEDERPRYVSVCCASHVSGS